MAQDITFAGEQLFTTQAQLNQALDIDTFIFANVPGQDPTTAIDRNEGLPPVAQRVHTQAVQQKGKINDNIVVYSTVLESITGPFEFNWVGLYSSVHETLVAVQHIPTVNKITTVGGAAGNTLNRNFGIQYSGIAALTDITVDAQTWQLDFSARLAGMDKQIQQLAADMNGDNWFDETSFEVIANSTLNSFRVTYGYGYVNGMRVESSSHVYLTADSYPQNVYIDAWLDGDASSTWKPQHEIVMTNQSKSNYIDESGKQHYMLKIAVINSAEDIEDLRKSSDIKEHFEDFESRVVELEKLDKNFTDVNEMLAYKSHAIGKKYSTGGTVWVCSNSGDQAVGNGLYVSAITPINILDYGVPTDGTNGDEELANAVNSNPLKELYMPPSAGYKFTELPSGIGSVSILASPKQRLLGGDGKNLPYKTSIYTGNKEVAIVSCCIRWYDSTTTPAAPGEDGWYTLLDGGEEHDPILMGPVSASGKSTLEIDVNLSNFGLNSNAWTPSGFVCCPDETLADSGITIGASVSSNKVTLRGTYNTSNAGYVYWDGSKFSFQGNAYENVGYSNGVLYMDRPESATKAAANFTPSIIPVMRRQGESDWGANKIDVGIYGISQRDVSLIFTDINGNRILTPDSRIKFWLTDSKLRNPDFNFGANPGGGTNIWMIGTFVKRSNFH